MTKYYHIRFLSRWFSGITFIFLLAGCSSSAFKPYTNTLPKNLTVSLSKNSDTGMKARVDIFGLDKQCQGQYRGTVRFEKKPKQIGIPDSRQSLLSFHFLNSHWLTGNYSISIDALIRVRPGHHYTANLSYVDSAYELKMYDVNQRTGKRKAIEIVNVEACREL